MNLRTLVLGITLIASPLSGWAQTSDNHYTEQERVNKQVVLDFYEKGINQKDADAAIALIGDEYIQHNPKAADGKEGFRNFVAYLKKVHPNAHSEIKSVFVDGDHVILHVHAVRDPGTRGNAITDIFRLKNGKIVEHWDTTQAIPEESANENGMF